VIVDWKDKVPSRMASSNATMVAYDDITRGWGILLLSAERVVVVGREDMLL
jgi:hypothetical protein